MMVKHVTRRTVILGGVAMVVPMTGHAAEEIPIPAEFDECVAIADRIIETAWDDVYPKIQSLREFVQKRGKELDHDHVLGLIRSNLELYQRAFDLTDYAKLLDIRYAGKDSEGYDGYLMEFGCQWTNGSGTVEHTFYL